jgi:Holliday junction DNA helicase RuvA
MITHLQGKLVEKTPTHIVVDCGGVGYFVHISLNTYSLIKEEENCKVLTYLAVREDAQTLYGFYEKDERELFKLLISVSGVGANTARMILSGLAPAELRNVIATGDDGSLKRIKGIGAKSAQRIIIDLKDKVLKEIPESSIKNLLLKDNTIKIEALTALLTLGFDKKKIELTLNKMMEKQPEWNTVEVLIKEALRVL